MEFLIMQALGPSYIQFVTVHVWKSRADFRFYTAPCYHVLGLLKLIPTCVQKRERCSFLTPLLPRYIFFPNDAYFMWKLK